MKKIICITLTLLISIICLCSCNLDKNENDESNVVIIDCQDYSIIDKENYKHISPMCSTMDVEGDNDLFASDEVGKIICRYIEKNDYKKMEIIIGDNTYTIPHSTLEDYFGVYSNFEKIITYRKKDSTGNFKEQITLYKFGFKLNAGSVDEKSVIITDDTVVKIYY